MISRRAVEISCRRRSDASARATASRDAATHCARSSCVSASVMRMPPSVGSPEVSARSTNRDATRAERVVCAELDPETVGVAKACDDDAQERERGAGYVGQERAEVVGCESWASTGSSVEPFAERDRPSIAPRSPSMSPGPRTARSTLRPVSVGGEDLYPPGVHDDHVRADVAFEEEGHTGIEAPAASPVAASSSRAAGSSSARNPVSTDADATACVI